VSRDDNRDRAVREMMAQAVTRLGIIEYLLLGLAVGGALLAGALTGWLAMEGLGWSFRWTWGVSSLLYFLVPAGIAWRKARREGARRPINESEGPHGG
jgi:uncharacterized membrane protein